MRQHDEKRIIELLDKKEGVDQSVDTIEGFNKEDKELYKSIRSMDGYMVKEQLRTPSPDFSSKLLHSLMSSPIRTSGKKLLSLLFWMLGITLVVCIAIVLIVNPESSNSTEQMTVLLNQINIAIGTLADPRLQQFLMVCEGIILLVIIEKIISSQRFYRKSF